MLVWQSPATSDVVAHLTAENERTLGSYRIQPRYVREHVEIERTTAQGGYENRQLYELIQNGADALQGGGSPGRIAVVLTQDTLYCANEGQPVTVEGLETILGSHMSTKRGTEIGRFGLGFKSVLAVTDAPVFHSRTGSFAFHAERSLEAVRSVLPEADAAPVLRLAWPLDTSAVADQDPVLRELAEWATTVVQLPLQCEPELLSKDLTTFPGEFLLFSPHVSELRLDDRVAGRTRRLSAVQNRDDVLLTDGDATVRWRVFSTVVEPSPAARETSGDRTDRRQLPLSWAVPLEGTATPGAFWAFFPTEYQSTLRGILNSPWKTTADRQNLQPALINEELLDAAAELVVASLPALSSQADPGAHLDAMPSRLQDAKQWADTRLNARIYELASERELVPAWDGSLRAPDDVELLDDDLTEALVATIGTPGAAAGFCHPSVLRRTRRARAERLCGGPTLGVTAALERLASTGVEGAAAAIRLLANLKETLNPARYGAIVKVAAIVPDVAGERRLALPDSVYLPFDDVITVELPTVADAVLNQPGVRHCLQTLGITPPTEAAVLRAHLNAREPDWEVVWHLIERMDAAAIRSLLTVADRSAVHVRTLSDSWRPADTVLLPSDAPLGDRSDAQFFVDTNYHGANATAALGALRISDRIELRPPAPHDPLLQRFRKESKQEYIETRRGSSPQEWYVRFDQERDVAGPWQPLVTGSLKLRAWVTRQMLEYCLLPPWPMAHSSRRAFYGIERYGPPELWLTRQYGILETSQGLREVKDCVGPALSAFSDVLSVAQIDDALADRLNLPSAPDQLSVSTIDRLLLEVAQLGDDSTCAAPVYELAALAGHPRPPRLIIGSKSIPTEDVIVCADAVVAQHLRDSGHMVLETTARAASQLIASWGVSSPASVSSETVEARDPTAPQPLQDLFPDLPKIPDEQAMVVSRCAAVVRRITSGAATFETSVRVWLDGNTLFAIDEAADRELLTHLDERLGLGLGPARVTELADEVADERRDERAQRVRAEPTLARRLVAAVGADRLRRSLEHDTVAAVFGDSKPVPEELAQVLLSIHGTNTLRMLRDELEGAGLRPPSRWKGSRPAEEFVRSLGFPLAFAGTVERDRPEVERVPGAFSLNPLHDYQEQVIRELAPVLTSDDGQRVLVTLPTGAGKTRTMVEALVREMHQRPDAMVIWIAQRDELCEQAVQAWTEVWRSFGPEGDGLTIGRLWGGRKVLPLDRPSVVVSTYQTLRNRVSSAAHDWLLKPDWVVIDEAHGATTTSYAQIRRELGLGGRDRERPLIGLTATPFRGSSEPETEALARLFGRNLIDPFDGEGLTVLQDRGVLALADHDVLDGVRIDLTDAEEAHVDRFASLPDSVEERLGRNRQRNEEILRSVLSQPQDWPILLFATSVHQAEVLAAQLSIAGRTARAISGGTERDARRTAIEQFDRGEVQVLTNYAVLHQGFDAPKVRAVYITRPTFSPATYQQMIGRGLRGPQNGGSERCLVVDVQDNIARFGGRLAFQSFDRLWNRR